MLPIVRSMRMNVYLSEVVVHHSKPPSMWKEGDRLRWRIENSLACEITLHACVRSMLQCCANQLDLHICALRCSVVPISRTRRLSPTASAVPPLSKKEGFPSLQYCANQPDPPAITHRQRGPPSFRERGLCYVAISCQLAGPGGYHPPLARSPLFQGKRAFSVHHPQSSFYRIDPRACTNPSLLPCGRRGTACGGGQRTRWLVRVPCMLACVLRCTLLPISQARRLSPTAGAVPPLSGKEGFCGVFCHSFPFLNLVPYFSLWSTPSNKRF